MPSPLANKVGIAGPTMPPMVPPAATNPNRRLAWVREKMSAMKVQNTEMMSMLNVLTQTKNAAAIQRSWPLTPANSA